MRVLRVANLTQHSLTLDPQYEYEIDVYANLESYIPRCHLYHLTVNEPEHDLSMLGYDVHIRSCTVECINSVLMLYSPDLPLEVTTIPHTLHLMWLSHKVDARTEKAEATRVAWQQRMPHWKVQLWTWDMVIELIQKHYPEYYEVFVKLPRIISCCDIARMMILTVHGGVYVDLDFYLDRPLDSLVSNRDLVLSLEGTEHHQGVPHLYNGFVAAIPQHPFIIGWVHQMFVNLEQNSKLQLVNYVLATTGPIAFYQYYAAHPQQPLLISPKWVNPFIDNGRRSIDCPPGTDYYAHTIWTEGTGWAAADVWWGILLVVGLLILLAILIWMFALGL